MLFYNTWSRLVLHLALLVIKEENLCSFKIITNDYTDDKIYLNDQIINLNVLYLFNLIVYKFYFTNSSFKPFLHFTKNTQMLFYKR